MRTQEAIGHVDADSFYVSAERIRNSLLIKKPVGVLGNQGACVIAKSYEMKAFGVKTGEPIWEAAVKCPNGIYVKRDFRWYEILSRMMHVIIKEYSPLVEYYSIDEFFFSAVPLPGKTLQETAEAIRSRIWQEIRVPVTVGISHTKTQAKLISDSAKPFGASAVLDDEAMTALLDSQPVTEISGISSRRAARLLPWNIRTCLDLARADRRLIRPLLTASGEALWWELRGETVLPILTQRTRHKILSRGGSLGKSVDSPQVLWAWFIRNLERLIEEVEFHDVCVGKFTVWVAYRNGQAGKGIARLQAPSQDFDTLLDVGRKCVREAWLPKQSPMKMQVVAEQLVRRCDAQPGLFTQPDERAEILARVKREINQRHGRFAIRSGTALFLPEIYRDPANGYDICDIRGKMCF